MLREDDVVEAVCSILRQLYRLSDEGMPQNRIDRIQRETLFFLYEGGEAAKWSASRPHSRAARQLRLEADRAGRRFSSAYYPITYEHAIPLVMLRVGLRQATSSPTNLGAFLKRHLVGVVILKSENETLNSLGLKQRMPHGAQLPDKMARYRKAGIEFEAADIALLEERMMA